jgi:hypothetical protein
VSALSSVIMSDYVTELSPHDVLFGRGSGPNDHEGNVRFRQLVASRKDEYMATNHRITKANIAREIVDQVLRHKGRFLKKIEATDPVSLHIPNGIDAWIEVDEDTVMEKAKQALRQNPNKQKGDTGPSVGSESSKTTPNARNPRATLDIEADIQAFANIEPIPIHSISSAPFANEAVTSMSTHSPVTSTEGHTLNSPWQSQQDQQPQFHHRYLTDSSEYLISDREEYAIDTNTVSVQQDQSQPNQRQQSPRGDEDSMLNMLPGSHRASLAISDVFSGEEPRRGSMTMSDLIRMHRAREIGLERSSDNRNSMDMDDMLDSFSRSKISNENNDVQNKRYNASTETMGTIEPIGTGSVADMSFATMNSSTFSFYKGNDSLAVPDGQGPPDRPIIDNRFMATTSTLPELGVPTSRTVNRFASDNSLSIAELRGRRKSGSTPSKSSSEEGSGFHTSGNSTLSSHPTVASGNSVSQTIVLEDQSLELDLNSMGLSSVEMLKGMILSSSNDMSLNDISEESLQQLLYQHQQQTGTGLRASQQDAQQRQNDDKINDS